MPVIYLAPFVLLSCVAAGVCLVVRRWRRYVGAAFVAPMAFAACSITGLAVMLVLSDSLGLRLGHRWESSGLGDKALVVFLYPLPGLVDLFVATFVAVRLPSKRSPFSVLLLRRLHER